MITVFRANSLELADIVVAWLDGHGIPAFVKNRHAIGTLSTQPAAAPHGIEIYVADPEEAARAKALLAEHEAAREAQARSIPAGKVFRAVCEECGRASDFPSELYGTVQPCPSCHQNMDVTEPPQVC